MDEETEIFDVIRHLQEQLSGFPATVTVYRVSEAKRGRPKLITARYKAEISGMSLYWSAVDRHFNKPKTMPPHWPSYLSESSMLNYRIAESPSAAWDLFRQDRRKSLEGIQEQLANLEKVVKRADKEFDIAVAKE